MPRNARQREANASARILLVSIPERRVSPDSSSPRRKVSAGALYEECNWSYPSSFGVQICNVRRIAMIYQLVRVDPIAVLGLDTRSLAVLGTEAAAGDNGGHKRKRDT